MQPLKHPARGYAPLDPRQRMSAGPQWVGVDGLSGRLEKEIVKKSQRIGIIFIMPNLLPLIAAMSKMR